MTLRDSWLRRAAVGLSTAVLATALVACGSGGGGAGTPAAATPAASTAAAKAATAAASPAATSTPMVTGGPSSSFELNGLVGTAATYRLADIQALPVAKVSTNAKAGTGELGLHEYAGPLLYDVLMKAQPKFDANKRNDLLRKSVVVTATDGYQVAVSWGELDPKVGNKRILLAYQRDGAPLPEADGFVRMIVPGDGAAGRYVSNVSRIELRDLGTNPATGERKPSTAVAVSGLIANPGDLDAAKLAALKQSQTTVDVRDASGAVTGKTVYGGVLLSDLLAAAAPKFDDRRKNDQLGFGVLAIGSDGYSSLIAGGEWDAKFANSPILVATSMDGKPLAEKDGFARLIVPADLGPSRYVSNLAKLEVLRLD